MAMMKKPKKPAFDASSLPKSKGITARPAKTRDASPNFVDEGGITPVAMSSKKKNAEPVYTGGKIKKDPGSNPGGSPIIKYKRSGFGSESGKFQQLTNKGNFEYPKSKSCSTEGKCPKPGYEVVGGGKKGTKAAPKKAMASSSSKMASSKKPMMKTTKK
jgi:hypothetical protein